MQAFCAARPLPGPPSAANAPPGPARDPGAAHETPAPRTRPLTRPRAQGAEKLPPPPPGPPGADDDDEVELDEADFALFDHFGVDATFLGGLSAATLDADIAERGQKKQVCRDGRCKG